MGEPGNHKREALEQFDRLLDLDDAARTTALARMQVTDPPLHDAVMDLLAADALAQSGQGIADRAMDLFGAAGVPEIGAPRQAETAPDRTGELFGPYRLERLLGTGGMGEVWLARRQDGVSSALVAIKLLHPHLARSAVRGRFTREGRILGQLAHPNIARLLDAGSTASGDLFLAIEHVDGERIDEWCDARSLDIPARLRLFLQVCEAVRDAHAHLVVHRDLKPSNILVTQPGEAKLLDFGIAKLLEDDSATASGESAPTELTRVGDRVLTPEYAAPEQILGAGITTATDVYALGVVLYVLLCGQRPFGADGRTGPWLEREVLEADPRPPSQARPAKDAAKALDSKDAARTLERIATHRGLAPDRLRATLRGDLDTIVGKAMKKAPAERYPSVAALADDVRRYLDHLPVLARPDSVAYRVGKFVRRNRAAVAASGAVAAALVAGVAGVVWEARVAGEQRRVAEQQRGLAEAHAERLAQVVGFQSAMLDRVNLPRFGQDFYRRIGDQLVRRSSAGDAPGLPKPEPLRELLDLLSPYANLTDAARDTLTAGLLEPSQKELADRFAANPGVQAALLDGQAKSYMAIGQWQQADALLLEAARLYALEGPEGAAPALECRLKHSLALIQAGKFAESLAEAQAVAAERATLLGPAHRDTLQARGQVAAALSILGRNDEALHLNQEVLAVQRRAFGEEDRDTVSTLSGQCTIFTRMERFTDAVACFEKAVPGLRQTLGDTDRKTLAATNNLGNVLVSVGRPGESRDLLRDLVERETGMFGAEFSGVLVAKNNLSNALAALGDREGAMRLEREIIEARLRRFGPEDPELLRTQHNYAMDLRDDGNPGNMREAQKILEGIVAARLKMLGPDHEDTCQAEATLAETLRLERVDLPRARALAESALAGQIKAIGPDTTYTVNTIGTLAMICEALHDFACAKEQGERWLSGFRRIEGDRGDDTLEALAGVAKVRRASGDEPGARALETELAAAKRELAAAKTAAPAN